MRSATRLDPGSRRDERELFRPPDAPYCCTMVKRSAEDAAIGDNATGDLARGRESQIDRMFTSIDMDDLVRDQAVVV